MANLFTENQVLEVLRRVIHPATSKDIITLHLVNSLEISEKKISFSLEFNTVNDPLKNSIKKACITLLKETFGEEMDVDD